MRRQRWGSAVPRGALVGSLALLLACLLVAALVLPTRVLPATVLPATVSPANVLPAPAGPAPDGDVLSQAATDLLGVRAAALRGHDRVRWLATVDPGATSYWTRQAELFDSLRQLPLEHWSEVLDPGRDGPVAAGSRPSGSSAWTVPILVRYRLTGYDDADVVRRRTLVMTQRGAGWQLTETPAGASAATGQLDERDLWELGGVRVRTGRASVVIAGAGVLQLGEYAELADAAAETAGRWWPTGWRRRLVVLVPPDARSMAEVLGGRPHGTAGRDGDAGLAEMAAVTTGGLAGGEVPDRVVVNPQAFAGLTATGRQVVLTHEAVHTATGSAGRAGVPRWLAEGLAEYVAHEAAGTSVASAAAPLLAQVRAGDGPKRLPGSRDFDPTRTTGAATADSAYVQAWLACRLLARRHGDDGLVALHRAVAREGRRGRAERAALEVALDAELGTSSTRLTADWRRHLRELAR